MSGKQDSTCRRRSLQVGEEFERWMIDGSLLEIPSKRNPSRSRILYPCRCKCGIEKPVDVQALLSGLSQSCGCLHKERASQSATSHGESKTRLYTIWTGMIKRCEDPANKSYKNYGAKGVVLCPEWRESYEAFRDWALANGYADDLTIERDSSFGAYEPSNCTWIPHGDQARNWRTRNRRITAFGETKCVSEWERDDRSLVGRRTILGRISEGMTPEEAMTSRPRRNQFDAG